MPRIIASGVVLFKYGECKLLLLQKLSTPRITRSVAQLVSEAEPTSHFVKLRSVAQLVARHVWDVEVPGSSPGTPTGYNMKLLQ